VHETPADRRPASLVLDPSVPNPARRYDYWLGGKDNFAADRASGDKVAAVFPAIRTAAIENRRFLRRAVTYLAREAGIRQFLDIGTGLPAAGNTHEVAQAIDPTARVVYADNDPMVLAHARALLVGVPEGVTAYLDADLRNPDTILADADLHRTLDLTQPVGLLLVAILHFLSDEDDPYAIAGRLVAALAPGSYLVASHATKDLLPPDIIAHADAANAESKINLRFRDRAEFTRFFTGLDLVSPGIACVSEWRAEREPTPRPSPAEVAVYGAAARIP
jgi:S-adenosyl methyltransferase